MVGIASDAKQLILSHEYLSILSKLSIMFELQSLVSIGLHADTFNIVQRTFS